MKVHHLKEIERWDILKEMKNWSLQAFEHFKSSDVTWRNILKSAWPISFRFFKFVLLIYPTARVNRNLSTVKFNLIYKQIALPDDLNINGW